MERFVKILNKYVIILMVLSVSNYFWNSIFNLFSHWVAFEAHSWNGLSGWISFVLRGVIVLLLILDFKKEQLKGVVFTCVTALFYPLLSVVIFGFLLVYKDYQQKSEQEMM